MDEQTVTPEPATEATATVPAAPVEAPQIAVVTNLDGSTPERGPDGMIPAAPLVGGPVGITLATCTLQPNAHYGDVPLASIPAWSQVAIGPLTTPDEYGRKWQQVSFGEAPNAVQGYIQLQNLRIG